MGTLDPRSIEYAYKALHEAHSKFVKAYGGPSDEIIDFTSHAFTAIDILLRLIERQDTRIRQLEEKVWQTD